MQNNLIQKIKDTFDRNTESYDESQKAIETRRMIDESVMLNNYLHSNIYPMLDLLYNGWHWNMKVDGVDNTRLENYSKLEHNFAKDTVKRWTAFLGGTPPSFSILNQSQFDISNDLGIMNIDVTMEENEMEAIQKIIWNFLRDNKYRTLFMKMVHLQSRYGRIMPFVFFEKGEDYPTIQLLSPYDTFPVFKTKNHEDILHMVFREAVDQEYLSKKFNRTFAADAIHSDYDYYQNPRDQESQIQRQQTFLWNVITEDEWRKYAGEMLIDTKKIKTTKCPFFSAFNQVTPFSGSGESDIETIIKNQLTYNKTYSNINDAIEDAAFGKRIIKGGGAGSTNLSDLADRHQRHVTVSKDTEIQDLPLQLPVRDSIEFLQLVSRNIEDQTGITELLKGRFSGSIATGVALSGLSRGIQDLALIKIQNLSEMLENVFNFVLELLKKSGKTDPISKEPYSKIIKRDKYYFNFIWDNASIQDERLKASTNIDLVNARLKSKTSAMKDLRTQYPEDEIQRVSYETMHPMMNPELAMQIAAMETKKPVNVEKETFLAKSENTQILKGQQPPVNETEPGQHAIHLQEHEDPKFTRLLRGKMKTNNDAHIKEHKEKQKEADAPKPGGPEGQAPKGVPGMQPGQQPAQTGGPLPGMGNENVRPQAMPGVGNPQAEADQPVI